MLDERWWDGRYLARLNRVADRRLARAARLPAWRQAWPPSDEQTREGDAARGVWLLAEADQALLREAREQRRRRLGQGLDPVDALALRAAARRTLVACDDLRRAALPSAWRRYGTNTRARDEHVTALLDQATPGAGDLYLGASQRAAEALAEADRLAEVSYSPGVADPLSHRALNHRPVGSDRAPALMSIIAHLLAVGAKPGVVLAVAESWDHSHNRPPLGVDEVERLARWVALRQAERLEDRDAA